MRKLLKKKSTKLIILLIALTIIFVILGFTVQSNVQKKAIAGHIEAAEKYLSDLDYEQAIAEYTAALDIDPKNQQIMDKLQGTYLAYAEIYVEKEEYAAALEVLQRGLEQTLRTVLQDRLSEVEALKTQQEEEIAEQARLEEEKRKEEELKEEAERKKQQEDKRKKEEDRDIYIWQLGQLDIITKFPVKIELFETSNGFLYYGIIIGINDLGEYQEIYEIEVNEETGNAKIQNHGIRDDKTGDLSNSSINVGNEYDLSVTDEKRKEYKAYKEEEKNIKENVKQLEAFIDSEWTDGVEAGYEVSTWDTQLVKDFGTGIWDVGLLYLKDGIYYFNAIKVMLKIDTDKGIAEIVEVSGNEGDGVTTALNKLVGKEIELHR